MNLDSVAGQTPICWNIAITALALNEITDPSVFLFVGLLCFLFLLLLLYIAC